jgi:hypothetical protein
MITEYFDDNKVYRPEEDYSNEIREVEVNVTVTMSKTITIKTDEYYIDSDGDYVYDNLIKQVEGAIYLPTELMDKVRRVKDNYRKTGKLNVTSLAEIIRDGSGWELEEIDAEEV